MYNLLFAITNSNLQIYKEFIDKQLDIIIKFNKQNESPSFKNLLDNAIDILQSLINQNISNDVKEYWHHNNYILNT